MVGVVGDMDCVGTDSDDVSVRLPLGGSLGGSGHQWVDFAERIGFSPEGFGFYNRYCVVDDGEVNRSAAVRTRQAQLAVVAAFARLLACSACGQAYQQQGNAHDEGNC